MGKRPLRKSLLLSLCVGVGCFAVIELFSLGALRLTQYEWFSWLDFGEQRRELVGETEAKIEPSSPSSLELKFLPHPYLGFVRNPAVSHYKHHWWIGSPEDPFKADPESVFVAILGGSVASNQRDRWRTLERGIREYEPYRDRKIVYVNLANAGYKQPQQLIVLNYYLALGGKVDVLINLDGFNEVGNEIARNIKADVYPHYPSYWSDITKGWTQPGDLARVYESNQLRIKRKQYAIAFDTFGFSATANLVWKLLDARIDQQIYRLNVATPNQQEREPPLHSQGPRFDGGRDGIAARTEAIALWARASVLLAEHARAHGFAYFHFLQPNQYVPGSKSQFSLVEQQSRIQREFYRKHIPRWYPKLQKAGAALRAEGVSFFDLTGIFRDVTETVYKDDCCHLTRLGQEILAREIMNRVVGELRRADRQSGD